MHWSYPLDFLTEPIRPAAVPVVLARRRALFWILTTVACSAASLVGVKRRWILFLPITLPLVWILQERCPHFLELSHLSTCLVLWLAVYGQFVQASGRRVPLLCCSDVCSPVVDFVLLPVSTLYGPHERVSCGQSSTGSRAQKRLCRRRLCPLLWRVPVVKNCRVQVSPNLSGSGQ